MGTEKKTQQAKNWCITINNPVHGFCLGFDDLTDTYMVCGEEHSQDGQVKGTPHIQGYVQFKKKVRFANVKKRWPDAHLEVAKGK